MHSTTVVVAPDRPIAHRVEKLLTGVALTVALSLAVQGLSHAQTPHAQAHGNERPASNQPSTANVTLSSNAANRQSLPDGAYLYGQASRAEQLGVTYLVFEVKRGNVAGAFYMPRSSFDCVHGKFQAQQLALTVVNSYESERYPYAVVLQTGTASASATQPEVAPVGLEGYYPIKQLSANDRRMLSTCKASDRESL